MCSIELNIIEKFDKNKRIKMEMMMGPKNLKEPIIG
jgi:hypothetical protein